MKLLYQFDPAKTDPEVVMEISCDDIEDMFLSIANREKRNRTNLYQQRHLMGNQNTSERREVLNGLNILIEEHFKENFGIENVFNSEKRYLAIAASDCTANLFRLCYDATWPGGDPLFYLENEPFREKEYYAFIVTKENGRPCATIQPVIFPEGKPLVGGKEIPHLMWLFCSLPLVYNGEIVDNVEMARNDYDLRHLFGKEATDTINEIFSRFNEGYPQFCRAIEENKNRILTSGPAVEWYHAGIGIKGNKLIVIHHIGSLFQLAEKFQEMETEHAILLDSGGSSVIWANWNFYGPLAHHWYFRPKRGAVVIFELKGKRKVKKRNT